MSRRLTKRQRLILRATVVVVLLTAACVIAYPYLGIDPPPSTRHSRRIEGITDRLARALPEDHPRTRYVEAAADFGVELVHGSGSRSDLLPEDMGPGLALDDLDGDGDLDLVLVALSGPIRAGRAEDAEIPTSGPTHRLFRNDGGRFTDVTAGSGLDRRDFGIGVALGDVDGDGLLDIYLTCYGPNRLLRNLGDLRFEDVTESAGVGDAGFAGGAVFGDPDRDGDLDLYVCNYVDFIWDGKTAPPSDWGDYSLPATMNPSSYGPPAGNRYYRNRGNGTFDEVAKELGIDDAEGKSLTATFADFNEDGWPDLYVLNDVSKNAYFENLGRGRFEDRSLTSLSADYRGAMGNAVGDLDGDGDLDLFITHWLAQENGAYTSFWRDRSPAELEAGKGLVFADVADMVGLGAASLEFVGWGTAFMDHDLDGVPDIVVVNGSTMPSKSDKKRLEPQRAQLFWQKPGKGFYELGSAAGDCWSELWCARGLAEGDLDGDGDLDIVVSSNFERLRILRNEGPTGHWLTVRLRQPDGNRFAVGARVELEVGGRLQAGEIGAGTSYLSHRPLQLTFGLGAATRADRLLVVWPDGRRRELKDVEGDRVLEIHSEEKR